MQVQLEHTSKTQRSYLQLKWVCYLKLCYGYDHQMYKIIIIIHVQLYYIYCKYNCNHFVFGYIQHLKAVI